MRTPTGAKSTGPRRAARRTLAPAKATCSAARPANTSRPARRTPPGAPSTTDSDTFTQLQRLKKAVDASLNAHGQPRPGESCAQPQGARHPTRFRTSTFPLACLRDAERAPSAQRSRNCLQDRSSEHARRKRMLDDRSLGDWLAVRFRWGSARPDGHHDQLQPIGESGQLRTEETLARPPRVGRSEDHKARHRATSGASSARRPNESTRTPGRPLGSRTPRPSKTTRGVSGRSRRLRYSG